MTTTSNQEPAQTGASVAKNIAGICVPTLPVNPGLRGIVTALLSFVLLASIATASPEFVPGRLLVKPKGHVAEMVLQRLFGEHGAVEKASIAPLEIRILQIPQSRHARAFEGLKRNPHFEFVELDEILEPGQTPNDPYYSQAWHLPKIDAPAAWGVTTGSANVLIAVLDTGVDASHPDLAAKLVPGWNVYDNNSNTSDVHGHGTAVAGVAAAISNNGWGVASVAWDCMLLPVRISDSNGYATFSAIAVGLTYAADAGARVANISYRASGSATVANAAQYFVSKGGVVAVAAGNQGTYDPSPDNPHVLTVSATDANDSLTVWSNTGNNINLAAPGVGIYTTTRGGDVGAASGTSFATPLVAGAAALVISANPSLTGPEVKEILKQTSDDLGPSGWDPAYGHGRLNAGLAAAVGAAVGDPEPNPDPEPDPPPPTSDTTAPTVGITSPANGSKIKTNVSISVQAGDNAGVTRVELYINGKFYASSTASSPTFSWKTNRASRGSHTLQAFARDAAGNVGSSQTITVYK